MSKLKALLERNKTWAASICAKDADFFSRLSLQQAPELLWIGCSDSRVPANEIIDLPPGEVFVHRNIANVVVHSDLNCLSVIQFAVEVLKIKHIIVCGHYGCGGIKSALEDQGHGLIDNWLQHVKDVIRFNSAEMHGLDFQASFDRLCELNIIEQVANVANTTIVQNAWENSVDLSIHGWIYNIENGILVDLGDSVSSNLELGAWLEK